MKTKTLPDNFTVYGTMALSNFRKETSERSADFNWARQLLARETPFRLESLEGYNQNREDRVTHLLERARVSIDAPKRATRGAVLRSIISLEGREGLLCKINFARRFGLALSYVLYNNERERVYLLELPAIDRLKYIRTFKSYRAFAAWIREIKGWVSTKSFREAAELPAFDKALRGHGTPWPANIDCFVCNRACKPLAIIEFQNARKTGVLKHCNNDYFQCLSPRGDDIRRWTSQEILRLQSGLRLFIITWAQNEETFVFKELDKVVIPFGENGPPAPEYRRALNSYARMKRPPELEKAIAGRYRSYSLRWQNGGMKRHVHSPPLDTAAKTFPSLYYRFKKTGRGAQLGRFLTEALNG